MKAIKKKLHSQSGVSVMMALFAFMVCMVVSIVILQAALTTTKTLHADQEEEQAYLTCCSAVRMVEQLLEETSVKRTTTTTKTEETVTRNNIQISSKTSDPRTEIRYDTEGNLGDFLKNCIDLIDQYGMSLEKTLTISVDTLQDVNVTICMDTEYGLTADFSVPIGSGTENLSYEIYLSADEQTDHLSQPSSTSSTSITETTGSGRNRTTTITTTTTITEEWTDTMNWVIIEVSKGQAGKETA